MKKSFRRIYAFLCMMVMLIALAPNITFADAASNERVAINVKVPADWQDPCVWAWDEDGNNAFAAWPGGECDARTDNEGWYYVWIPASTNHVIVNANNGGVQTDEIILEGKDAWITVEAADKAEVSYDAKTKGDTPEYVEKFTVHAKVDDSWKAPGLWAWSAPDGKNAFAEWPGKAMKQGEDGWYTAQAPVFVNSIIINANDGSVQTEDLSIDAAEIWVTVDKDGKADFSYKDPDKAAVENINVYVKAPSDWSAPCLWAWSAPDGTNVFASWPGEALEEKDGWLTKEIPGWVNSIIVNGNEGSVQTTDISIETGKDVWVVVKGPEDYEVTYEAPAVEDTADVAEAPATEVAETPTATSDGSPSSISPIIIAVIAAAVVAIVVVVIIIAKKKKA